MNASLPAERSLWLLDPSVTFLNHGSFGACPIPVLDAQNAWRRRLEAEPVLFLAREFIDLRTAAQGELARLLNAPVSDLVWVANATEGTNCVISSFPLSPGDEILVTDHEYGAVLKTVRVAAERRSARVVVARIPFPIRSHAEALEAIEAAITPRTRLAVVSQITSPTALILPAADIVALCRNRGVAVLVDSAHAPGMVDIDITALGADFHTGNCHKWLYAPKGAAYLHVAPEWQSAINPMLVSHGWFDDATGAPLGFQSRFCWQGTGDPTAALCVPAALAFLDRFQHPRLRSHGHALARRFRTGLANALGTEPPTPDSPDFYGTMATMPLPVGSSVDLQARLFDKHRIEVPVIDWRGERWIRISGAAYTTGAEVDRLVEALRRELIGP